MRYKLVLFDMDGTLVDSFNYQKSVFTALFRDVCGEKAPDAGKMIGMSLKEIFCRSEFEMHKQTEYAAKLKNYYFDVFDSFSDELVIQREKIDIISELRASGVKTAIATNTLLPVARKMVSLNGSINAFDALSGAENLLGEFNKHERCLSIMDSFKAGVHDTIYVGDMISDLKVASELGIDCAILLSDISWIFRKNEPVDAIPLPLRYSSFKEIRDLILS